MVTDSTRKDRLEDATVSLHSSPGMDLLGRVRSRKGFVFQNLQKGTYLIITTNQGYLADTFRFKIEKKDISIIICRIFLKPNSEKLLEVVVRASIPPVIVKSDTIVFNAEAYASPPNSSVEDLLKKLPGIQIDKDGNVTMNGQNVDKIRIDGKDFFLGDPRLASQNLPADIVEQVEAYNTQSDKANLTGIKEQSNTKTLNIKLKKNRNKGYYGKIYAGGGTNNGYSVGGSATRLQSPQMLLLSVNANNINNQFTGTEHSNGNDNGLQISNSQQFNYRDEWSKKLNATVNFLRNYNDISVNQQLNRQTSLTDSAIIQNSLSSSKNVNTNTNGNLYLEYKPDTLTQIDLRSNLGSFQSAGRSSDSVSIITQKANNRYLSSLGKTENDAESSGNQINNSLDFRRLFSKKGRLIYLSFAQSSSLQDQPASLFSNVTAFDSTGNRINAISQNQRSTQKTNNNGYSVSASYTEPLGSRHVLDFNYTLNKSSGHSDKKSFNYDSLTGKYDQLDSQTTNRFQNHTTVQSFGAGYNTTEGKYRFQIGLTGQITCLGNLNLMNDSTLGQQTLNWIPRVSLLWQLNKASNINVEFTGMNQAPSIDQLQPIPDLTNPYLIKTGNPDLKQQLTHSLSINYGSYNETRFKNWQVNLNGNLSHNFITSSSTVLAGGVQQLQYVNVQGVYHLAAYISYGFPIQKQKYGNASVSIHGQYGHDVSLINGQQNIAASEGIGGAANLNFHVKDSLFVNLIANIEQTKSDYSLQGSPSSLTLNENYTVDVSYRLFWSLTVSSYYTLQITGNQNNLPSQAVSIWNAVVYRTIFNNRGEIRFSAFDLLNSSSSFSQTTGVNFVQTQETNRPGRLFLLSLVWRIKKFR
jgi:hypothetical protein